MRRNAGAGPEAGLSLVEMIVAMAILSIVTAVFVPLLGIVQKTVVTEEARSSGTDQVRLAAQQLDRHIRSGNVLYDPADETAATLPGVPTGYALRIYTQANGTQKCVQWRLRDDRLEWRSWTPDWRLDPATKVSAWRLVAERIVNGTESPPVRPFSLDVESSSFQGRVVRIALVAREGASSGSAARIELSVAGRNTQYGYANTGPAAVCGTTDPSTIPPY